MNTSNRIFSVNRLALSAAICATMVGCSEEPPEPVAVAAVTSADDAAAAPQPDTPAPLTLASQHPPASAMQPAMPDRAADAPANAGVTPTPVAEYQPPFPDRIDLFMPPKREGGARGQGDSDDTVQLLGFVEVDRPEAVLSINGLASPVAAGEIEDGVEVISIQPPMVLLQRGRQRWQATLEE
jgi:hypothetical protein